MNKAGEIEAFFGVFFNDGRDNVSCVGGWHPYRRSNIGKDWLASSIVLRRRRKAQNKMNMTAELG